MKKNELTTEEKELLKKIPCKVVNQAETHLNDLKSHIEGIQSCLRYLTNCIAFMQGYLDSKSSEEENNKKIEG